MQENEREATAWHEAAHCVIGERLGYRIKIACIHGDESKGSTKFASPTKQFKDLFFNPRDLFIFFNSGNLIQQQFFPNTKISHSDEKVLNAISLLDLCFSKVNFKKILKDHPLDHQKTERELLTMLSNPKNLESIREIARILINHGKLNGNDIRDIIQRIDASSLI